MTRSLVLEVPIDSEDDVVMLYLESHGDRHHELAVDFPPLELDSLTPEILRKMLDDARIGPPLTDVTDIRERLHHNVIHPLQRRAVQVIGQLDTIIGMYEGTIRGLRGVQTGMINSVGQASTDPVR